MQELTLLEQVPSFRRKAIIGTDTFVYLSCRLYYLPVSVEEEEDKSFWQKNEDSCIGLALYHTIPVRRTMSEAGALVTQSRTQRITTIDVNRDLTLTALRCDTQKNILTKLGNSK